MNDDRITKIARVATVCATIYLLAFGVAMALFPIRPFWNDEWRLIYNVKFKTVHQLWGTLDLLQQCPRVYLTVMKWITASFDYSYISLRLPALVITVGSVFLLFYLCRKIFPRRTAIHYLFILILVSSQTFTDYIVQVKQYEMEILLCLLALWQLMELLKGDRKAGSYMLLCITFLVAPFFSYTYPIVVAPIFLVVLIRSIQIRRFDMAAYAPLALLAISIVIFYFIDVRQLMGDTRMYTSYRRMLGNEVGKSYFIRDVWSLFSLVGSGFIFEIIFGVLGITALGYGIFRAAKARDCKTVDYLRLYAVLLLAVTILLFATGKLMGSVARLTAFTVPSIALLIVLMLEDMMRYMPAPAIAVSAIVFLGLAGNIFSTCINRLTRADYPRKIHTYWNTCAVLKEARAKKTAVLYTDGIRGDSTEESSPYPGKIEKNTITAAQIAGADTLCAEVVLKVNPEYKVWDTVDAYHIPDMKWTTEYMNQLPANIKSAIAFDGIRMVRLSR